MKRNKGFTLLEMLLVLIILSGIIGMWLNYTTQHTNELKRDQASIQYQQVLNAALNYYLNSATGGWPTGTLAANLQGTYLPNFTLNNPWGKAYSIYAASATANLFYVYSQVPVAATWQLAQAQTLAGRLPGGFLSTATSPPAPATCTTATPICYVVAAIPPPGQNLNNARSVNFANIYHPGACVPAPVCPANMTQEIFVVPVQVQGLSYPGNTVYPIESFAAWAYGAAGTPPTTIPAPAGTSPADCEAPTTTTACQTPAETTNNASTQYWRVCMKIITPEGDISAAGNNPSSYSSTPGWAANVSVLAITRCAPNTEPVGSDFTVYTN